MTRFGMAAVASLGAVAAICIALALLPDRIGGRVSGAVRRYLVARRARRNSGDDWGGPPGGGRS